MKTNTFPQNRSVSRTSADGFIGQRNDFTRARSSNAMFQAKRVEPLAKVVAPSAAPGKAFVQTVDEIVVQQFDLPQYQPPQRPLHLVRKKADWRRRVLKMSAAFAALVLLVSGTLFARGYANVHKVFRGTNVVAALSSERVAPELLNGEGDGRVNILMLGAGGKNHPGGDLTDTIIVLSVDPVNKTAAMLSVPRDLWVKMPVNYFGPYQKINAAYSSGKYKYLGKTDIKNDDQAAVEAGFASVDEAVSSVLGIHINYHVLVDFQAFEQAIDTVNGVVVDVKQQLYDPTMAWENGNNPVLAPSGVQLMNGKKALIYARSRETSSDFARSERQRQLLLALKEKVLTLGTLSSPTRIDSLMSAFGDNVRTDLSTKAASRLFSIMKDVNDSEIASLSLTTPQSLVTTDRIGDVSVVRPKAGFNTYSDIQAYVRSQLLDGYLVKEKANVYVLASNEALRNQTVSTLNGYGYSMLGSSLAQTIPSGVTIVDLSRGKAPYTQHYLQDRYGVAATQALPTGIEVPTAAQFVILAGT